MMTGCSFSLQCSLVELLIQNYLMCWLLIHSDTFCLLHEPCKSYSSTCFITALMCECDGIRSVGKELPASHTLHMGDSHSWRFPNKGKRREKSVCVWILGLYFKVSVSPGFHQYKYQYCKKPKESHPNARRRAAAV